MPLCPAERLVHRQHDPHHGDAGLRKAGKEEGPRRRRPRRPYGYGRGACRNRWQAGGFTDTVLRGDKREPVLQREDPLNGGAYLCETIMYTLQIFSWPRNELPRTPLESTEQLSSPIAPS